jgi:hypothetical protein
MHFQQGKLCFPDFECRRQIVNYSQNIIVAPAAFLSCLVSQSWRTSFPARLYPAHSIPIHPGISTAIGKLPEIALEAPVSELSETDPAKCFELRMRKRGFR